jgi:SpoVK/Ycf46/Vps4 family AAA+-type ATPase
LTGNGKTSFVQLVASLFSTNIYLLSLEKNRDGDLSSIFAQVPPKSIILIEDFDTDDPARIQRKGNPEGVGGLSQLLNAMDGVTNSMNSKILIATSNKHPGYFDPALIRPGRIDRYVEFVNPDLTMALKLFKKFFPDSHKEIFPLQKLPVDISMAKMQGDFFSACGRNPAKCFEEEFCTNLEKLWGEKKEQNGEENR